MSGHQRDAVAAFLATIHGDPDDPDTVPGYLFLGRGREPALSDTGAVHYARWEEEAFSWPRQAVDAINYAVATTGDVFHTPCRSSNPLRKGDRRAPQPTAWLWADIDNMTTDARHRLDDLVARGAVTVDSGGGAGRVHVYLPLDEPVPAERAEHLNRRLAVALGADPAVGRHVGYLRVAGTLNRKPTARGETAAPVVLHPGNGAAFAVSELDDELPDADEPAEPAAGQPDAEPVELDQLPPALAGRMNEPNRPGLDRSAAMFELVAACRRAGFTVGQAVTIAGRHAPSVTKYGARLASEVGRVWHKLDDTPPGDAPGGQRKRGPDSVATQLVRLAVGRYRFAQDDTGRGFGVPLDGPAIARPIDGGAGSLRDELARRHYDEHGKAASKSALADAAATLAGMAGAAPVERLGLRSIVIDGATVLVDLGRADGAVVEVTADGWRLLDRSPVVFRRTELTGELPVPVRGDGAAALRRLVNVPDELAPLLTGWLAATFLTDAPRPILALFAEQGAGKSTAARALVAAVDPSPVPLRAAPSGLEQWIVAAAGSSVVAVDNLSRIEPWLSDALCRAATGEGLVRRKLYSDDALAVTTMRRSVVLTSIDAGALRGDLAERLLPLELDRITPGRRRTDADLAGDLERDRPAVLAHLLDALAGVLAHRHTVPGDLELPRMADFGRVLAALDQWGNTDALGRYLEALDRVAVDVVEGDPLAAALRALADGAGFDGTATELLRRLAPWKPERGYWPDTPRALAGAVRRAAPTLRAVGVDLETRRTGNARTIHLRRISDASDANDGSTNSDSQGKKEGAPTRDRAEPRGSQVGAPSRPSQPSPQLVCDEFPGVAGY